VRQLPLLVTATPLFVQSRTVGTAPEAAEIEGGPREHETQGAIGSRGVCPPWPNHLRWPADACWMPHWAARPAILHLRFLAGVLPYNFTVGELRGNHIIVVPLKSERWECKTYRRSFCYA